MTYELPNINEIIITKTFELFQSPDDNNIFMQLEMLHEIKKEYSKLLEDVFYNNKKPIDNTIIDLFTEIIDNKIENIEVDDIESLFNKLDIIDNNKIVVYRSNETPEAEVIINSENVESDDEYIDIEYLSKYNKVERAIIINASKKFYVYFFRR